MKFIPILIREKISDIMKSTLISINCNQIFNHYKIIMLNLIHQSNIQVNYNKFMTIL